MVVLAGSLIHQYELIQTALRWRGTPWAVNGAVALFVTLSLWQSIPRLSDQPRPVVAFSALPVAVAVPEQDLNTVFTASLFGEQQASPAETPETAPLTSLNLVLKGVVAIKDAGMAFVSVQGKPEELYVIGQEVAPGATLSAVQSDRIILRRGGQFESLMLDGIDMKGVQVTEADQNQPMFIQPASSGRGGADRPYVVSRAAVRAQVQSPQALLSQAVLVPNAGGGFLLKEVESDSLIEEFGLRPGDVIRSVNGQTLNYADDIRRAYEQLSKASQVKVELLRDGKKEALHYRVEEGTKGTMGPAKQPRTTDSDFAVPPHDATPEIPAPPETPAVSNIGEVNESAVGSTSF